LRVRKIHINKINKNNNTDQLNETINISNMLILNEEKKGLNNKKAMLDTSEREPFNNKTNDDDSENEIKCRICLEGETSKSILNIGINYQKEKKENILISPCNCKGEHKYIHLSCLKKWLKSRYGTETLNHSNSLLYSFPNKCEICQGVFPDVIETNDSYFDLSDFMDIKFDNYIEFEILSKNKSNNNKENFVKKFLVLKLLKNNFCLIGKGRNNHYIFTDQNMSDYHAKLLLDNNGNILLSDNNSDTGTFVKINGPIKLIENNIMFIQNRNTYIKLELYLKNNCCFCPRSSIIYPEYYFKNNNLWLNLKKIFKIKEKEIIEYNSNNNNNIDIDKNIQIQIKGNGNKNNIYSNLTTASNNSCYNSTTNLAEDINDDNNVGKLNNKKDMNNININNNNKNDSILNKSKHTINNENICPNINNENDISFANSRNESIQ
jgi:hypothetical protein